MFGNLFQWTVIRPIIKTLTRILVGLIAIPLFRLVVHKSGRIAKLEAELEKDLEEWFRAALVLLVATANMEHLIFGWVPLDLLGDERWVGTFFRLLLVVGVIELMPDQALFSVLHSGPLNLPIGKRLFHNLWNNRTDWIKKIGAVHLNRSSPVFAMMSAIFGGEPDAPGTSIGWICYVLAIVQYLIIALITSADKAGELLEKYDKAIGEQRKDLVDEFTKEDKPLSKAEIPSQSS